MYGASGVAFSIMGIHPDPIGTPAEVEAQGYSLASVGSCAPAPGTPGGSKGVAGCPHYHKCIFRFTRNGGFRDQGPKNIGYFHQTHEGKRVKNQMACYTFQQTLYERMRAGIRDREDGKNGEIIRIIAQEGEKLERRIMTNVAPVGQPPKYERKNVNDPVPAFPRPGEMGESEYDVRIRREEQERQRVEEEALGPPLTQADMSLDIEDDPEAKGIPVARPVRKAGA